MWDEHADELRCCTYDEAIAVSREFNVGRRKGTRTHVQEAEATRSMLSKTEPK